MSNFMFLTEYEDEEKILVNLDNVLYMEPMHIKRSNGNESYATRIFFGHGADDYQSVSGPMKTIVSLLDL
jgi:hypothetical protein